MFKKRWYGYHWSVIVLFQFSLFILGYFTILNSRVFAVPTTFTVSNTNDSGAGSLRQAIDDANSNANPAEMDTIEFNIAGSGVHTINIISDLPDVTELLTIDGYSQPGASENTTISPQPFDNIILIEIAGTTATITNAALQLVADSSIVKGLSIYDAGHISLVFDKANIKLIGDNTIIQGCYIGLKADGFTIGEYDKNSVSVTTPGNNVLVGGSNPQNRNIISNKSSSNQSAALAAVTADYIYGNYLGMARDGITDLTPEQFDINNVVPPFAVAINQLGDGTVVGGPNNGEGNLISGNSVGIAISSSNNIIQGNYIGTDYEGNVRDDITNGFGITSTYGSGSLIGGVNPGEGNLLAGLSGSAIELVEFTVETIPVTLTSNKVSVLGNVIHTVKASNLNDIGKSNMAIDLADWTDTDGDYLPNITQNRGPTSNDINDVDTGANGYINKPLIKSAQQIGNQINITYDLDSADSPSNTYRVEFYANNESTIFGHGPGEFYLGNDPNVSPGNDKTITLNVGSNYAGKTLSATTTAIDGTTSTGFGSTSEFSKNITIGSADDKDGDGVNDIVEDAAPNNGDGNNDNIVDKDQSNVTTYEIDSTGKYATLISTGCIENNNVKYVNDQSLSSKDTGKSYPYGLTQFGINCSRGDTADIELYIHDESSSVSLYKARKYNSNNFEFSDVSDFNVGTEVLGERTSIKLSYSISDGGSMDEDGTENGVISDPVGLALASTTLADTGANIKLFTVILLFIILVPNVLIIKHRNVNPKYKLNT